MGIVKAANEPFLRATGPGAQGEEPPIDVPQGHVGPLLLSSTGRTVWWTGRVAIGLRYEPPRRTESCGQSALWIQRLMLRCG